MTSGAAPGTFEFIAISRLAHGAATGENYLHVRRRVPTCGGRIGDHGQSQELVDNIRRAGGVGVIGVQAGFSRD